MERRARLARVRATGFAIDDEKSVAGLTRVAASIRDARHVTVASVSISGPSAGFGESMLPLCISAAGAPARLISERHGSGIHAVGPRGTAPEAMSG